MKELTQQRLKQLFEYDESTGLFKRIARVHGAKLGSIAGHLKNNGYIHFSVDGKKYGAHRLAWLFVYGHMPNNDIDHIDGNRANNAIRNLRCVDRSTNLENSVRAKSHNKGTGLLGAYPIANNRYASKICVRGKTISLGCYSTAEQAHQAYMTAKKKHHQGFLE